MNFKEHRIIICKNIFWLRTVNSAAQVLTDHTLLCSNLKLHFPSQLTSNIPEIPPFLGLKSRHTVAMTIAENVEPS